MKETKEIPSIHPRVLLSAKPIYMSQQLLSTKALVALRIEKLCGKVLFEKDNDMVMRNFVRIMYHLMANYEAKNLPSITISDTGGNARTGAITGTNADISPRADIGAWTAANTWYNCGLTADSASGIQIGLGILAPARTDFVLGSLIPHGGGAGAITYNTQTYALLSDSSFSLTREFTNAGSILSVTEAGMVYGVAIAATAYKFLLLRDTFAAIPIAVGNGVRIIYTWSF